MRTPRAAFDRMPSPPVCTEPASSIVTGVTARMLFPDRSMNTKMFMERSGKSNRTVTPVTIDEAGSVQTGSEGVRSNAPRGVRITFAGSDGAEKTLYYFSTDLSNGGVKSSGFLKFCATLAPGNSLIKSASYLLHSGSFTTARDFLLANSATIIQDDSGIPLADYGAKKWRFFPFGHYLGPIGEFPGRYQKSYAELFRRAQPMDFGIGYRWRTHELNLLLSVKLGADEAPSADATASTGNAAAESSVPKSQAAPRPSGFFWFGR